MVDCYFYGIPGVWDNIIKRPDGSLYRRIQGHLGWVERDTHPPADSAGSDRSRSTTPNRYSPPPHHPSSSSSEESLGESIPYSEQSPDYSPLSSPPPTPPLSRPARPSTPTLARPIRPSRPLYTKALPPISVPSSSVCPDEVGPGDDDLPEGIVEVSEGSGGQRRVREGSVPVAAWLERQTKSVNPNRVVSEHLESVHLGKGKGPNLPKGGARCKQAAPKPLVGKGLDLLRGSRPNLQTASIPGRPTSIPAFYQGKAVGIFDQCKSNADIAETQTEDLYKYTGESNNSNIRNSTTPTELQGKPNSVVQDQQLGLTEADNVIVHTQNTVPSNVIIPDTVPCIPNTIPGLPGTTPCTKGLGNVKSPDNVMPPNMMSKANGTGITLDRQGVADVSYHQGTGAVLSESIEGLRRSQRQVVQTELYSDKKWSDKRVVEALKPKTL